MKQQGFDWRVIMKKSLWFFAIFISLSLWSCKVSSGIERRVHPENWVKTHYLQVQNAGEEGCMECHPPEGDWPDAPACTSCHSTFQYQKGLHGE